MVERRQLYGGVEGIVASLQAEITGLNRLLAEIDKRYAQQFTAQEKAVGAALAAAEKAVAVAEQNSDKWRTNANEWRGAMDDREDRFVQKEHLNPMLAGLQKEVNELKNYTNQATGKGAGMDKMWAIIVGLFGSGAGGVVGFLLAHFVK